MLSLALMVLTIRLLVLVRPGLYDVIQREYETLYGNDPYRCSIVDVLDRYRSGEISLARALVTLLYVHSVFVSEEEILVIFLSLSSLHCDSVVSYIVACIVFALSHLYNLGFGVRLLPVLQVSVTWAPALYALLTDNVLFLLALHFIDHLITNMFDDILELYYIRKERLSNGSRS